MPDNAQSWPRHEWRSCRQRNTHDELGSRSDESTNGYQREGRRTGERSPGARGDGRWETVEEELRSRRGAAVYSENNERLRAEAQHLAEQLGEANSQVGSLN